MCSFLLVRKGSTSEYDADPALDYYQLITIRLYSPSGCYLENLARVVAPEDEVRRYMDHVMEIMTRAEYVLLAMRLPRPDRDDDKDDQGVEEPATNGSSTKLSVLRRVGSRNVEASRVGSYSRARPSAP